MDVPEFPLELPEALGTDRDMESCLGDRNTSSTSATNDTLLLGDGCGEGEVLTLNPARSIVSALRDTGLGTRMKVGLGTVRMGADARRLR